MPVTRGRKSGDTSPRSIGHELKLLRYLLNRAVDNEVIETAPKIKTPKGAHRRGAIKEDHYREMLGHMRQGPARYLTFLWETGWRLNEPRKLKWKNVDIKNRVLRLDAEQVKEDYDRVTPILHELLQLLLELKEEQRRMANLEGFVLIRKNGKPIKSIREAFLVAKEKVGISNAIPHDLRRSTIRRWESMGINRQAVMQATGHRPVTVHEQYAELDEEQLVEAFSVLMVPPEQRPIRARAVNYN